MPTKERLDFKTHRLELGIEESEDLGFQDRFVSGFELKARRDFVKDLVNTRKVVSGKEELSQGAVFYREVEA